MIGSKPVFRILPHETNPGNTRAEKTADVNLLNRAKTYIAAWGVFTLIFQEHQDVCEWNEGIICFVEFVIPCKDPPELFDITEIMFYNVASFVQFLIIFPRFLNVDGPNEETGCFPQNSLR